ncbi:hypothetical protein O181_000063 [Austropuccinia psidii MF-1]|uniref:Uncharacterized protein n=1 Tax=Austropuccinia psidii MF-1 TaxID=1389203 RepID=A0A9Q3B835_9BASI|nr:hypothetical protein [Austropuccinia psidii MF-1]
MIRLCPPHPQHQLIMSSSSGTPPRFDFETYSYFILTTDESMDIIVKQASLLLGPTKVESLGQVGELEDENIVRLGIPTGDLLRDPAYLELLKQRLLGLPGIRQASLLELPKTRTKHAFEAPPPAE